MHHDDVAIKVDEAHRDLVQHVLSNTGEGGNGQASELWALVQGERGPGVQEVLTAKALAALARQVVELTERVRALEATKDTKPTLTKKGR